MKGRQIPYSAAELEWIEARKDWVISDLHRAFCEAFGRGDVSLPNLHALRKRKGWKTGRTGCFVKGQAPVNKGKPHPARGRSAETQFKKGGMSGRAQQRYKPIGTERVSKDGYVERKVHDGFPTQSRWRAVQRINWEALNGPLPKGHALKCLDGDRSNTDAANWLAVPRAILPRLAGGRRKQHLPYDDAAPAVRPALLAVAHLEHQARELRKRT